MGNPVRDPARLFAAPAVTVTHGADRSLRLRSPIALLPYNRAVGEYLEQWAVTAPDRLFLQERGPDGRWRGPTYAQALSQVRAIATGLVRLGASESRPLVILSDNSAEHALLMLAALHVGVPVTPVSPAYSLLSKDFAKLKRIVALVEPGVVYVADGARFAPALAAIRGLHQAVIVAGAGGADGARSMAELAAETDAAMVERRFAAVGPDTVAKLLFTSGSTGEPKGVITTQRMLCANQQAKAQVWPFLAHNPPVIVDWLPWSHTFGANHNFNLVMRHGGTLYVDGGRPVPGLFDQTLANLREVSPTIYFNVPRGYDMLVTALRADADLRASFFRRLQVIFYAAAALPANLWDALTELAHATVGEAVPLTSAWGSTETAPLATDCHFQADQAGVIGLPIPGTELKLVPNGLKSEVRVRGPNVTPGYWKRPDLTAAAFDEEGFYRIGDAVRLVDPDRPERGLLFDGRVSEDFKLDSGTWVNAGMLRVKAIAALAPVAQDVVIAGQDRAEIGFLIFPNLAACRALDPSLPADAPAERVLGSAAVRAVVAAGLARLRDAGEGSSTVAGRAILLADPPSIDAGEITDKGYLNQRAVLMHRKDHVDGLYAAGGGEGGGSLARTGSSVSAIFPAGEDRRLG